MWESRLVAELAPDVHRQKNLLKRGSVWYVRLAVPRRLWGTLGKKALMRTLGTTDLVEALEMHRDAVQGMRTEIARLEALATGAEATAEAA